MHQLFSSCLSKVFTLLLYFTRALVTSVWHPAQLMCSFKSVPYPTKHTLSFSSHSVLHTSPEIGPDTLIDGFWTWVIYYINDTCKILEENIIMSESNDNDPSPMTIICLHIFLYLSNHFFSISSITHTTTDWRLFMWPCIVYACIHCSFCTYLQFLLFYCTSQDTSVITF